MKVIKKKYLLTSCYKLFSRKLLLHYLVKLCPLEGGGGH